MDIMAILTQENWSYLFYGALMSLAIATVALIGGVIIGILVASMKLANNKVVRLIGNIYVEVIRGTPMLLQILFIYLGVPSLYNLVTGGGLRMNIYVCGCVAMALNSGAYSAELIRSGILSIDKGQREAGITLGLTDLQIMRLIILPQAIRRIIPPLVSEFITLIKDSSLLGTIGVMELLNRSKVLGANYYNYLVTLTMASIFYLGMTLIISLIARRIEKRLVL